MNIVHVVEPFAAGISVFVRSLTVSMPDDFHIIIHGERKKVMPARQVKSEFPQKNIRFIKWRSAQRAIDPVKDAFAFSELYTILRRLKKKGLVDAVHLHSSKSGLLGRAACRLARIDNVFYTPNGASFLSVNNRVLRLFYKQLEKFGNRLGGKVICCSASEFNEYKKLGIDAAYINNGVALQADDREQLQKKDSTFRVVTSGRIEIQKQPALFNAIAQYFEGIPGIEFTWIGDGPDKYQFTSRNIRVTGWMDAPSVQSCVASADLYLSTSKYEGLSFAVLEALALRKPVLLSNCTGNSDIVKRGINGALFTNKEEAIVKILQYYTNPEMLPVMGAYSEEICQAEFDVEQNFKNYREVYAGSVVSGIKHKKWGMVS